MEPVPRQGYVTYQRCRGSYFDAVLFGSLMSRSTSATDCVSVRTAMLSRRAVSSPECRTFTYPCRGTVTSRPPLPVAAPTGAATGYPHEPSGVRHILSGCRSRRWFPRAEMMAKALEIWPLHVIEEAC